jgi:hypothetical protein
VRTTERDGSVTRNDDGTKSINGTRTTTGPNGGSTVVDTKGTVTPSASGTGRTRTLEQTATRTGPAAATTMPASSTARPAGATSTLAGQRGRAADGTIQNADATSDDATDGQGDGNRPARGEARARRAAGQGDSVDGDGGDRPARERPARERPERGQRRRGGRD